MRKVNLIKDVRFGGRKSVKRPVLWKPKVHREIKLTPKQTCTGVDMFLSRYGSECDRSEDVGQSETKILVQKLLLCSNLQKDGNSRLHITYVT